MASGGVGAEFEDMGVAAIRTGTAMYVKSEAPPIAVRFIAAILEVVTTCIGFLPCIR